MTEMELLINPLTNRKVSVTRDWAKKIAQRLGVRELISDEWLRVMDRYGIVVRSRWDGFAKKEYHDGDLVQYTKMPNPQQIGGYVHHHIEGLPHLVKEKVDKYLQDIPFVYGITTGETQSREPREGWVAMWCSYRSSCD